MLLGSRKHINNFQNKNVFGFCSPTLFYLGQPLGYICGCPSNLVVFLYVQV